MFLAEQFVFLTRSTSWRFGFGDFAVEIGAGFGAPDELPDMHVEALSQALEGFEADVGLTALDAAHEGAVDLDLSGEGLLGEAGGGPQTSDGVSEAQIEWSHFMSRLRRSRHEWQGQPWRLA